MDLQFGCICHLIGQFLDLRLDVFPLCCCSEKISVATQTVGFFDQMRLEALSSQLKGRSDPSQTSANDKGTWIDSEVDLFKWSCLIDFVNRHFNQLFGLFCCHFRSFSMDPG